MITIYCLASEDTVWYVGSTNNCRLRENKHRSLSSNCGSKDIPEGVKWNFIALEEVDEEIRTQAERFYYEWLEPKLNFQVPGRTDEEYSRLYSEKNKDIICLNKRLYRQELKTKE